MAEVSDKKGIVEDDSLEGRAHETLEREFNEVRIFNNRLPLGAHV